MSEQPSRTLCLWPGLAGLWQHGQLGSLTVAVVFGVIFNLALTSTFIWSAWLGDPIKILLWSTVGLVWLISCWSTWRRQMGPSHLEPLSSDEIDDTLFIQAQTEYLKGEFTQAESLLAKRLHVEPRDAEARLLLVSLYRRSGRSSKAAQQLQQLQRLDSGHRWKFEIQREQMLINQTGSTAAAEFETRNPETNSLDPGEASPESLDPQPMPTNKTPGNVTLGESATDSLYEPFREDKEPPLNPNPESTRRAA